MPTSAELWTRYQQYLCVVPSLGLTLDISRMNFPEGFIAHMQPKMQHALDQMEQLEGGAIANPDEKRMVGHYWLRNSALAPKPEIKAAIDAALAQVKQFAADVHAGKLKNPAGQTFTAILVIGIGGSALGPQFVADALTSPADKMAVHFFDNTDPDGMDRTLAQIGNNLGRTLAIVISKSGGTKETRNGMLAAAAAYQAQGIAFAKHAVAVTGEGSELDNVAKSQGWIARFPMWDWVGGRTSELSAVGLLPAALQGLDIDGMLAGARDMDIATRNEEIAANPAALLALMWYHAGGGKGVKDMVVLPYKDRLLFLSKYLQQLVMESLGKEKDRDGNNVYQGIAVYGNKGSTDQHAYVQQLREGINNFFVTFIEVLKDRSAVGGGDAGKSSGLQVESNVTSGDYLHGFFQGTRKALADMNRENMTIAVQEVSPRTIGALIALYERAVGLYAELVNINAYHQPGVEAGKKAAGAVIALQAKILAHLRGGKSGTADQIALALGVPAEAETVFHILRHVAANPEHGVKAGDDLVRVNSTFSAK